MQKKIKTAIIGYGNIGKNVYESILNSNDLELCAVVIRNANKKIDIDNVNIINNIEDLKDIDVAFICTPSRNMPEISEKLLKKGINCVDSFDIHSEILNVRNHLNNIAIDNKCVAVTAAGWDPGTDSVLRTIFLSMAPKGITYTNFGPGVSMGHSVVAKSKNGVKDAMSITVPKGEGLHRRMVYVELLDGFTLDTVAAEIKADDYFSHDETHVIATDSINNIKDLGHGVTITRKGMSASAYNQQFTFDMRINNPALTAQIMVSCARAAVRQRPGCYTMIEIAPIDYLEIDRETAIKKLV